MYEPCCREVERLHRFLEAWLEGRIPRTEEGFADFRDALADDFVIVHPGGQRESKETVANGCWQAHGAKPAPFSIEIRNCARRYDDGRICLLTYEEWQRGAESSTRISTALFRRSRDEGGVEWVHLHETWLLDDALAETPSP